MGTTSLLKRVLLALLSFFALVGVAFTLVWVAMEFKLLNVRGSTSERNSFFTGAAYVGTQAVPCFDPSCEWQNSAEWSVVRAGLQKDSAVINRVASETGVPARIIAFAVKPEVLFGRKLIRMQSMGGAKRNLHPQEILSPSPILGKKIGALV